MPMRLCSKCGNENLKEAKQCIHCGQTFPINKYVKCDNCGLLMDKEASYCLHCDHENDQTDLNPQQLLEKIHQLEFRVTQLEEQLVQLQDLGK